MNVRFLIFIFLVISIFLIGALGLTTVSECNQDSGLRDSQRMQCYHMAGISEAYLAEPGNTGDGHRRRSIEACNLIWSRFGAPYQHQENDIAEKAEMTTNKCFHDIAKILRDPGICSQIRQRQSAVQTGLFGEDVSSDLCEQEASRLEEFNPENYHGSDRSLCKILFVLPFLILTVFLVRV